MPPLTPAEIAFTKARCTALQFLRARPQQYGKGRAICSHMASVLVSLGLAAYDSAYTLAITSAGLAQLAHWAGA
jgi:hypothetical protein